MQNLVIDKDITLPTHSTLKKPLSKQIQSERFYRPELDGLRFFAFLAVYIEHTVGFGIGHHNHLPDWLGNLMGAIGIAGTFGVDLFFVLSSYLITELLLRERLIQGVLNVKAFYIRRILRIWPLYFLFVFVAYAATFIDPSEGLTWKHVVAFFLFSGNWAYSFFTVTTIAAPLWSISVEEQFYLIWPWVIRNSNAHRLSLYAIGIIIVGMIISLLLGIIHPSEDWVSKNSFTRIDGVAIGALIAVFLGGQVPKLKTLSRCILLTISVGTLLLIAYYFGLTELPVALLPLVIGWPLVALACGGILFSVLGSNDWFSAPLRSRPMVYLGRISFGLYVYHELTLKIGDYLFPNYNSSASQMIMRWVFGFFGTLLIAMASYRWLEQPFLRLKRNRYTIVQSRPD